MQDVKSREAKPIRSYLVILVEILTSFIAAFSLYGISIISSDLMSALLPKAPLFNTYFVSLVTFSTLFSQYPLESYIIILSTLLLSRLFYLYMYSQRKRHLPLYSIRRAVLPNFYAIAGLAIYSISVIPITFLIIHVDYSFIFLLPLIIVFLIALLSVITSRESIAHFLSF